MERFGGDGIGGGYLLVRAARLHSLAIPYRYLYPSALFFICIDVYSVNSDLFAVGETLAIGAAGFLLLQLGFHPAPILLGFVLGPRFEENFRRAMLISGGDLNVFIERPISAAFLAIAALLVLAQLLFWLRRVALRSATAA